MSKLTHPLYDRIRQILNDARSGVYRTVNMVMVHAYFEIGRAIVEDEQKGEHRAEYGKEVLKSLSGRLTQEFGQGFSVRNLQYMRKFFIIYGKWQTVSAKLTWSHNMQLICVENVPHLSITTATHPRQR